MLRTTPNAPNSNNNGADGGPQRTQDWIPSLPEEIGTLPPFANEKNRQLDKEIRQKELQIVRINTTLQDQNERADAMQQHMKNVSQEIHYTQALVDARSREIDTEKHFKSLAERESGRLKQDLQRINKEITTTTDQINSLQNTIYTDSERAEKLRNDLKIGKEELEEWLRVQQEKEEDSMALEKYAKEDEQKMRELSLQIQKLVEEVHKKKNQLSQEMTETEISQLELERTADNFRRIHAERQDLLQKWELAIKTMKKRDEEIEENQEHYQQLKDEVRAKQAAIDERQRELEEQTDQNHGIQLKIESVEREITKRKTDHAGAKGELSNLQDELELLKKALHKTSQDTQKNQKDIAGLKEEMEQKKVKLEKENAKREAAEKRLEELQNTSLSLEQRNVQLQELLKQDEARSKELDRELKALKITEFRESQTLKDLRSAERTLTVDISAAQNALKNLISKSNALEQDAMKQQSLLYKQAFLIEQLERKVRRAQGERSDEEKEELLKKIDQLTATTEDWKKKLALLQNQHKRVLEDLRQAKRLLVSLEKEKSVVVEQIAELNLYNDSASSQLAAKIREKEDMLVDENIMRLEVRKLRSFLNARSDNVLSLENRQAQLQLALEERTKEIEIHKDMLRAHIKTADEERSSANAELRDRLNKIDKLKRKYEIVMSQFSNEEGEERSQAYFLILASQKKEELQREGDQLDSQIKKTEKEVRALENTLGMINNRNEGFRHTLKHYESDQQSEEEKHQLEQQFQAAMEKYRVKRRHVEELEDQLQHLERALTSIAEEETNKLHQVADLESRIEQLNRDLADQQQKRDRAHRHCMKLAKEWRQANNVPVESYTPEEVDFDVKEAKDFNRMLMTKLAEVAEQHPQIEERLQVLCKKEGIPVLSRPATARSMVSSRQSGLLSRGSNAATPVRSRVGTPLFINNGKTTTGSAQSKRSVSALKTQKIDGSML